MQAAQLAGLQTIEQTYPLQASIRELASSTLIYSMRENTRGVEQGSFRQAMNFRLLQVVLFVSVIITGEVDSTPEDDDKNVLISLKHFLEANNKVNYDTCVSLLSWRESEPSPCGWLGVRCNHAGLVEFLDLSGCSIFGPVFGNFSGLRALARLDLSNNSISGVLSAGDLDRCGRLAYLNLSHNLIGGQLRLTGLPHLQTLDVSQNRFRGASLPATCDSLTVLTLSSNSLAGSITDMLGSCRKLEYVDISSNAFTGNLWPGVARLKKFDAGENSLAGEIMAAVFPTSCRLQYLDLTSNQLHGDLPSSIENCTDLVFLSLGDNNFSGLIPAGIGGMARLDTLVLGGNRFDRRIPPHLANCSKLRFLDMSDNTFGGQVQETLGKLASLRHLLLRGNMYTGDIVSSGILGLPRLARLDLMNNNFSGDLPDEVADMKSLRYLFLKRNNFSGEIPPAYGRLTDLQVLGLSYNELSGSIPASIGNLSSLLFLLLAGNRLTGRIPPEIGNCSSLIYLEIEGNQLSGSIPPEIARMGSNPWPTFLKNRNDPAVLAGLGVCLSLTIIRPIYVEAADSSYSTESSYTPIRFFHSILTRHNCHSLWDKILKGYEVIPLCTKSPSPVIVPRFVRLSENMLSGELPSEIGMMQNLSLLHLGENMLSGFLPPEISNLPLISLNLSKNSISGPIPSTIGQASCLELLDLSCNNFSGELPSALGQLTKLNIFNVSYNRLVYGDVPTEGQFGTFDERSFLGDPLISFRQANGRQSPANRGTPIQRSGRIYRNIEPWVLFSIIVALMTASATFFITTIRFDLFRKFIPYGYYL